jgi:hypothetical protein
MKHINPTTKIKSVPAAASLLETQAKVAIFGAFAAALGTFGDALGTFIALGNKDK